MEVLKSLRKERGITLAELALALGTSKQVLSRYEHGQTEASYEMLKGIARYFDVSVDYLLGNSTYYYPDRVQANTSQLTAEETKILQLVRSMTPSQQARVIAYCEGILGLPASAIK